MGYPKGAHMRCQHPGHGVGGCIPIEAPPVSALHGAYPGGWGGAALAFIR